MSKSIRAISWTSPNGSKAEVKIEITKEVVKNISYSDGWNVDLGDKIYSSQEISVYINGKLNETSHQNPIVIETSSFYTEEFKANARKNKGYAKITNTIIVNEERYNEIMAAIESAKAEVEAAFNQENQEIVKAEKEKEEAAKKERTEQEIEWASKIIEEATNRKAVLTRAEERQWRIGYNNINNEGGEGYIPNRATLEDLEEAKYILRKYQ